jgi:hypothetical protein
MWSDRVEFVIPWDNFNIGASIFIPSMHPADTLRSFKREADQRAVTYVYRVVVENGVQGLRVWRT